MIDGSRCLARLFVSDGADDFKQEDEFELFHFPEDFLVGFIDGVLDGVHLGFDSVEKGVGAALHFKPIQ